MAYIHVDSHVHLLPLRLAAKIRTFFEVNGLSHSADEATCCPRPAAGSAEDLPSHSEASALVYPHDPFAAMDKLIVDAVTSEGRQSSIWTLPYAHVPDISDRLNESIVELTAQLNERADGKMRILPGCTCHPGDMTPFLPHQVLERAARRGARVAKLHCSVGQYSVMDERMKLFWELLEKLRMPCVIHAGVSIAGVTDGDDLQDIDELCTRFPNAKIILAHSGHPSTSTALALMAKHRNLYMDTTPVVTMHVDLPPTDGHASQVLHLAMTSRILYGSDAPNTAISREDAADNVRHWLRECVSRSMGSLRQEDAHTEMERNLDLAEEQVFGGAALRLEQGVQDIDVALADLANRQGKL